METTKVPSSANRCLTNRACTRQASLFARFPASGLVRVLGSTGCQPVCHREFESAASPGSRRAALRPGGTSGIRAVDVQ